MASYVFGRRGRLFCALAIAAGVVGCGDNDDDASADAASDTDGGVEVGGVSDAGEHTDTGESTDSDVGGDTGERTDTAEGTDSGGPVDTGGGTDSGAGVDSGAGDATADPGAGADWHAEATLDGEYLCLNLEDGTFTPQDGSDCPFMIGQGLNVDFFGAGSSFDNTGTICFETENFQPVELYDTLMEIPDSAPCDGVTTSWAEYVEGFEGLVGVGLWLRESEGGRMWKVLVVDNIGSHFEAYGVEVE